MTACKPLNVIWVMGGVGKTKSLNIHIYILCSCSKPYSFNLLASCWAFFFSRNALEYQDNSYEMWHYHGSEFWNMMPCTLADKVPMFWRNQLLLFYALDRGKRFLWNMGLVYHTAWCLILINCYLKSIHNMHLVVFLDICGLYILLQLQTGARDTLRCALAYNVTSGQFWRNYITEVTEECRC
jgi:hypothetical protein